MDEFHWIEKIRKLVSQKSSLVHLGIGDDAAILEPLSGKLIWTVDTMVEGVHFDSYFRPDEIGHKALSASLSDIAAMGGKPKFALVSLGVDKNKKLSFISKLYKGILNVAKQNGVVITGGNLSISPVFFIDISVLGHSTRWISRGGACSEDIIAITGPLGESKAGFLALNHWGRRGALQKYNHSSKKHLRPNARIKESQWVLPFATSLIDISDGLSSELNHLSKASNHSMIIYGEQIPISREVNKIAKELGLSALDMALHGGEDYELLMTLQKASFAPLEKLFKKHSKKLFNIGRVLERGKSVYLSSRGRCTRLSPRGWIHKKHKSLY